MEKVIRNGEVAVLISPGYGAGWSTWNSGEDILLYHPKLVEMVESGNANKITSTWMKKHLGLKDIYCGGAADLEIRWIPEGTSFTVEEYDGAESLRTKSDLSYTA